MTGLPFLGDASFDPLAYTSKSNQTVQSANSSSAFDIFMTSAAPGASDRPHTSPGPGEFASIDQSFRLGTGGSSGDPLEDRRDSLSPLSHNVYNTGSGYGPDSGVPMSPGASYMSPLGASSIRACGCG